MKYTIRGILLFVCAFLCTEVKSQTPDSASAPLEIPQKLSKKYIDAIGTRSAEYQQKMEAGSEKYLGTLKEQEVKIKKQLDKTNPEAAQRIFEGSQQKYEQLQNDLKNNSDRVLKNCGKYVPGIDSAITSLKFLEQNELTGKYAKNISQIKDAMAKVKSLQDQFKKTDNIEEFIKERKAFLQQQLSTFKVPGLEQYNQQASYYAQQMNEYKEAWEDPSKMEKKAVEILNKLPAFREFMQQNSMVAGLFNIPTDYSGSGVAGLQTRTQVEQMMQQQMTVMGPAGAQSAQQNIGDAQSSLTTLRNKVNQGSSELEMPDGKGNSQHTKTFLKRLEYGINIQNTRSNFLIPQTTDFALTAGYKLNNRSVIGIGMSYNVGWGTDIQHIKISSQGIGFRAFLDVLLKGSFYASGGYEKTYSKIFTSLSQLETAHLWQTSGLLGVSKIISLRGKILKKTKVQLLWNFLSYYQTPKTQPLVFRLGYNF